MTKSKGTVVTAVRMAKNANTLYKWHYIEPERIFELLNILIDEKVNDEGGHGRRVVERLANLGFSKSKLLALQFAQGDVDELFEEDEDDD